MVGVEDKTIPDQLQLSKSISTFLHLGAQLNEGTISKVDSKTGAELGRIEPVLRPTAAPPEPPWT
jgi:hypothetical protein